MHSLLNARINIVPDDFFGDSDDLWVNLVNFGSNQEMNEYCTRALGIGPHDQYWIIDAVCVPAYLMDEDQQPSDLLFDLIAETKRMEEKDREAFYIFLEYFGKHYETCQAAEQINFFREQYIGKMKYSTELIPGGYDIKDTLPPDKIYNLLVINVFVFKMSFVQRLGQN